MRKAVRVSAEVKINLNDEILVEPGSLAGAVHLQGMTDHRSAIVLFIGTNRFTAPFDSTGRFSVETLAPGPYLLRVINAESGFAAVETTITVKSGTRTNLPAIELSKNYIPVVDDFTVVYDPAMMMVTMRWTLSDTARVSGYNIYCNRSLNLQPVATVSDTCSTLTFDLIKSTIDTFTYQIAAVANDGSEGPATVGEPFAKTSAIDLVKTISHRSLETEYVNFNIAEYYIDQNENIYEVTEKAIQKMDSNGVVIATYRIPDSVEMYFTASINRGVIETDETGNFFMLVKQGGMGNEILIRFDARLNVRSELSLATEDNTVYPYIYFNYSYALCGDGSLFLLTDQSDSITRITKYDSNFVKINERILADNWKIENAFFKNDTNIAKMTLPLDLNLIGYFDTALNLLSSFDYNTFLNAYLPKLDIRQIHYPIFVSPRSIFMSPYYVSNADLTFGMLLFFNNKQRVLARFPWYELSIRNFCFDYRGNLYAVKRTPSETGTDATIYKYSTERLFQEATP